jgi:DNA polymerase-3 subunit epsilon
MREICLDLETTGLEPRDGHRIIEIGCVELVNKIRTGNYYHAYVDPERDMPEEAFKIHGISGDFLKGKPKFAQVNKEFLEFIKGARLVIHNASFDMKFINFELRQCNLEIIERGLVIDSLEIARNKFPGAGNSLDALCKRFNVDTSRRVKHGALLDAELLAEVYLELSGGGQTSIFEISGNKKSVESEVVEVVARKFLEPRQFALSPEELTAHKEFITKNFKQNLWGY